MRKTEYGGDQRGYTVNSNLAGKNPVRYDRVWVMSHDRATIEAIVHVKGTTVSFE